MTDKELEMETHDWSKAPHDATHFGPDSKSYSACYYKKADGVWYFNKAWCAGNIGIQ